MHEIVFVYIIQFFLLLVSTQLRQHLFNFDEACRYLAIVASSITMQCNIVVSPFPSRSNHKLFENIQFSKLVRELVANSDVERPFFTLNLRSILLNLSSKVPVNSSLKKISDKEKENCSDQQSVLIIICINNVLYCIIMYYNVFL